MDLRRGMPSRERRLPALIAWLGEMGRAATDLPLRPRSTSLQVTKTPHESPPTATQKLPAEPTSHSNTIDFAVAGSDSAEIPARHHHHGATQGKASRRAQQVYGPMSKKDLTIATVVESHLTFKPERLSYISNSTDSGVVMDEEERNTQRATLNLMDPYDAPWAGFVSSYASTRRSSFSTSPSSCAQNDLGEACVIPVADEGLATLDGVQQMPPTGSVDSRESYDEEDDGSTVIQDGMDSDLDKILGFSLQVLHGMELSTLEPSRQRHLCRLLTVDFVEALERIIHHPSECPDEATDADGPTSATSGAKDDAGALRPHRAGAVHAGTSQQVGSDGGVRDSNDRRADALTASKTRKRSRDENARLGCPFRERNQLRFNVRDYPICALVSFPSMRDLRQHVVRRHHRYDPTRFLCDRCNMVFPTKSEQQQHAKQREPCLPRPVDPEDGIDNDTAARILSRGRGSSQGQGQSSVEAQYAECWGLIFPDSQEVPDHTYHVVMEDSDLEFEYKGLLSIFIDDLRTRFCPADDQLLSKLRAALIEYLNKALENCRTKAKNMTHHNKPEASIPKAKRQSRLLPSRDSAIGTDTSSTYGALGAASGPSPLLNSTYRPLSQPPLDSQSVAEVESQRSGATFPDIPPPNEALASSSNDLAGMGMVFPDVGFVSFQGLDTAGTLSQTHGIQPALPLPQVPFPHYSGGPIPGGWTTQSGGNAESLASDQHELAEEQFHSHHWPIQNEPQHPENFMTLIGYDGQRHSGYSNTMEDVIFPPPEMEPGGTYADEDHAGSGGN
ncbi:hypothetical protein B0T18DRAFT_123764 [Schizothecium vesticola]|uniref:C2H2-type domain-containing protein n=1 Tax=Schizothecium vesticola TaxID=314040 RepID=A0AA40F2W3_9PEZI|nr:hypothetical protein B0T18DRAFT_123764 [Schizothecium vesticola]